MPPRLPDERSGKCLLWPAPRGPTERSEGDFSMRTTKLAETERTQRTPRTEAPDPDGEDTYEIHRVECPECHQPIALLTQEERLPLHGRCATSWDPFGVTECPGAGTRVTAALPVGPEGPHAGGAAELLTLPAGLDWRRQPFSHVGVERGRIVGQRT